ncbi:NfeD family protein [Thalassoglobus sp. JC818]|uniref:NfeD family protein n=1 Tax=Thalassoglobus sp. JC818 TaxID=3232136 RepID=UPI00345A2486
MDAQVMTFVLLLVGFLLLGLELFLPSGGVIGVMCAASFLGSAYFAYTAWATSHPLYWRIYLSTMVILAPITLYGIYYLLTQTAFGNRILLTAPTEDEVTPYQEEQNRLQELVGERGKALNLMTPGGLVEVNGERLHAISEDMVIESGQSIEVVGIRGTRVLVRIADALPPQDSRITKTDEDSPESDDSHDRNVDLETDPFDPFLPQEES